MLVLGFLRFNNYGLFQFRIQKMNTTVTSLPSPRPARRLVRRAGDDCRWLLRHRSKRNNMERKSYLKSFLQCFFFRFYSSMTFFPEIRSPLTRDVCFTRQPELPAKCEQPVSFSITGSTAFLLPSPFLFFSRFSYASISLFAFLTNSQLYSLRTCSCVWNDWLVRIESSIHL